MTTTKCDVVVIGAGISGLTAARKLKKQDPSLHVVVLEAKDRVGGRTQTVAMKSASGTDDWDLGGQWVGRSQPHIMSMLEELKIGVYPQYIRGTKFMQLGDNKIRTYSSDIPSLSVLALIDLQLLLMKVERMRKRVDVEDPWACKDAAELDSMTMETFLQNTLWTKGAGEAIESASRCMMGVEVSQISALFYLMYVSAAGGVKNLVEATEQTAQEYKIQGGAQQISTKLMEAVGAGNVFLSEAVTSVTQNESAVIVKTVSGNKYDCKRVICSIPLPSLDHVDFEPHLPEYKQELMKRMPLGSMIKILVTYKRPFWREHGQSGEAVSNGGPALISSCDSGPLCIVYDATSCNGNPALVSFIGGYQAIQWSRVNDVERQRCILQQLTSYFGPDAEDFLDYREKNWTEEPYTMGGPVCCAGTGTMQYFAAGLREPVQRVHFAGTETATKWCGYMSGAVQAGYRAAEEVLAHLRPDLVSPNKLSPASFQVRTKVPKNSVSWVKLTFGIGAMAVAAAILARHNSLSAILAKTL